MKKIVVVLLLSLSFSIFAQGVPEEVSLAAASKPINVIASTSWTAAFADLGGLDDLTIIAPASLVHPPEYEITVNDVLNIDQADYFIYAGYERMMQSMGDSIKKDSQTMIKINTNNSMENVTQQAKAIANLLGTEDQSAKRLASYIATIEKGKEEVKSRGMDTLQVYCHSMQIYLAQDLGLQIDATFGPGPLTANQIATASKNHYDIIIDNIHNPIAAPLLEVSPNSKLVVWRNFPSSVERGSLEKMVQANIDALLE
ncbi:MAG: ABC transporter substrate-binding protein [Spirochaetia bacterium]|nr:ABC transporter substrate-binding protein [Spirochaetia bacterium]